MAYTLVQTIGNTPLVQLNLNPQQSSTVYAKLEYLNPGGSIKDRSARFMIEWAKKNGILKKGGTIVDASSGNHGIALAMIGASEGYRVIISTSEKFSTEKLNTIRAYGAEIVMCPATPFIDDPNSYHSQAKKLAEQIPGAFMPDQYFNRLNALAHYTDLGPEIWRQTNGTITHFFAAAGTGGTISGVGKFLKEKNPAINIIAIDSNNSFRATKGNPKPYKLEGVGVDFVSPVLDYTVIDQFVEVSDEDAFNVAKKLARTFGMLVGLSSAAVAHAVEQHPLPHNSVAVIIFGDSGRAYLSKNLF